MYRIPVLGLEWAKRLGHDQWYFQSWHLQDCWSWWGWQTVGKPGIAFSVVFNVSCFLELLKLSRNYLSFWLPCRRTFPSFPHHGGSYQERDWDPTKNSTQNWIATNRRPLQCTDKSLFLIIFHKEAWKGTGILCT